jgi:hypothetical protein
MDRVSSWRNFKAGSKPKGAEKKKKSKISKEFRPPKPKMEQRD